MKKYADEDVVDQFLDHIRWFTIAHHVLGRIRVKVLLKNALHLKDVETADLEEIIARVPGVLRYRVNKKALSVVIEYDPQVLPYELWEDVASIEKYPLQRDGVKARLLALLADTSEKEE